MHGASGRQILGQRAPLAAQITAACDDGDGANDIGFIFG